MHIIYIIYIIFIIDNILGYIYQRIYATVGQRGGSPLLRVAELINLAGSDPTRWRLNRLGEGRIGLGRSLLDWLYYLTDLHPVAVKCR